MSEYIEKQGTLSPLKLKDILLGISIKLYLCTKINIIQQ